MYRAKLIAYSAVPKIYEGELSTAGIENIQDLISYCARVSNPKNQSNTKTTKKLLKYLIDNKHWSPFEMANATIAVETTRDIARQLLRHRSFSFQEFSQRYASPNELQDAFVYREARLQDPTNRQNSIETDDLELQRDWRLKQDLIIHEAKMAYKWAVENGIAKEVARTVLPEGNTVSRLCVNGTIRSWIHYIELRTGHGTQKEHIKLARECAYAISRIFPAIENHISRENE